MDITDKLSLLTGAAAVLVEAGYASTDGASYSKTVSLDNFRVSVRLKDDDSLVVSLSYSKGTTSNSISVYRSLTAAWDGKDFTITGLSDIETACSALGATIN